VFDGGRIQWVTVHNYGSVGLRNSALHIYFAVNGVDTLGMNLSYQGLNVYTTTQLDSGVTPNTLNVYCSGASGGYMRFIRGGTVYGYFGNGAALIGAAPLDSVGIRAENAPILFSVDSGGTDCARFTSSGSFQITGGLTGTFRAAAGIELGVGGGIGYLQAYNRATSAYFNLYAGCTAFNVFGYDATANTGDLWLGGKRSITNFNDGSLYINYGQPYASGIQIAGFVNMARTVDGISCDMVCSNGKLRFYGHSGGSAYIQSHNPSSTINLPLIIDAAGTTINVSTTSPSFVSTSSRAIKRETGTVRKASDILARLRPLLYRLLSGDDKEQLGLVAEEVHEVCPQLSDGKTVAYDRLAILLLAAWQDERAAV
jgi:hypothetical protein